MDKNFVFLDEMLPGIRWDAKYATWDNFTGKPVDGYKVNRVVGTKELGEALYKAKELAEKMGYGLLLWDGYRPQCAVNCFLHWASLPEDNLTKKRYYPNIKRSEMDMWLHSPVTVVEVRSTLQFFAWIPICLFPWAAILILWMKGHIMGQTA